MRKITPETSVKLAIKDYLTITGWYHYPNLAGIGSEDGLADRTAIKNGVTVWIEVKSLTGTQGKKQKEFEAKLKDKCGHYILARSVQDVDDYINKNLWSTGVTL